MSRSAALVASIHAVKPTKANVMRVVFCVSGCGPSVAPSETTADTDVTTGAPEASTGGMDGSGSAEPDPTTTATDAGGDDGRPKLDVPPQDPRANPCDSIERLGPTECFAPDVAYPPSDLQWPLVDGAGSGCALVCMTNVCATDACFDVPDEIRIVHDGVRTVFLPRNLEIVDDVDDRGAPIRRVEGWDDQQRVHIERALRTNAYSAWATDETTGELLWGPVTMHWLGA